jgi:hypothetical protein
MEEKEEGIDTEYSKYKSVLSILGIGNRKDKLDSTMNTTLEELRKLWNDNTDYTDIVDSIGSVGTIDRVDSIVGSDEPPQPKAIKLTIDGLHKIEGSYKWGYITNTLHNESYYIIEFHTNSKPNVLIEATIYRVPLEDSKIRIDLREYGKASIEYRTYKEGFRNRKDFVRELFTIADDYLKGDYYK